MKVLEEFSPRPDKLLLLHGASSALASGQAKAARSRAVQGRGASWRQPTPPPRVTPGLHRVVSVPQEVGSRGRGRAGGRAQLHAPRPPARGRTVCSAAACAPRTAPSFKSGSGPRSSQVRVLPLGSRGIPEEPAWTGLHISVSTPVPQAAPSSWTHPPHHDPLPLLGHSSAAPNAEPGSAGRAGGGARRGRLLFPEPAGTREKSFLARPGPRPPLQARLPAARPAPPESAMAKAYDHLFKLLLIGDSGVGKTCLIIRFAEDNFNSTYISTIGIDFKIRTVDIEGKKIKLQVWDTAGQERFKTITTAYYRGAMGIILVYDITDEKSFENIQNWMKSIKENASAGVERLLLGNKCDMEGKRKVQKEQADKLAREHGIRFFETSAKSSMNVDEAFSSLARDILLKSGSRRSGNKSPGTELKTCDRKNSSKCSVV